MTNPFGAAFPEPPAVPNSNSNTVGMQRPVRMPQTNTNSATLPGSSAGGGFGGIGPGLGGGNNSYGYHPDGGGGLGMPPVPMGGMQAPLRGIGSGQPASIINLAHSSDVVIGPMTQYQGSVTIYQYMDATFDTNISGRRGPIRADGTKLTSGLPAQAPHGQTCGIFAKGTSQLWAFIILFVSVIGIVIGLFLALQHFQLTPISGNNNVDTYKARDIRFSRQYEDGSVPSLGNGHMIVERNQWGAGASRVSDTAAVLERPIPHVIITHFGVQSVPCNNIYNCSVMMRTIQDAAIAEKGLDDLNANFYVSSDGYVYVGRGWDVQNVYTTRSIAVCFMGDYIRYEPTERQLDGVQRLLEFGITQMHLRPDFLMVAHNQTKKTDSPGVNVFKYIVKWPHWYSGCGVDDKPQCDW